MKRFLFGFLTLVALLFTSCSEDISTESIYGTIFGIVTDSTGEPMRATGVELYKGGSLLLKTVTYDDGHYEFDDLTPGDYVLRVVAEGYESTEYNVIVESGRTARADMLLRAINMYLTVTTNQPEVQSNRMVAFKGQYSYISSSADEVGFIYGKEANLSLNKDKVVNAEAKYLGSYKYSFTASVNIIESGTWYVMAYAKNMYGYAFGTVIQFENSTLPDVETLSVTNLTATTATLNGRVGNEGDPKYTEKGFVYSGSFSNPTVDDPTSATTIVKVSGTSKDFSANISGLDDKTKYYVRAYIKSSEGISYGESVSFNYVGAGYITLASEALMVQLVDLSSAANWDSANELCEKSRVGGYSDWRLPNRQECEVLNVYREQLKLTTDQWYWTSTKFGNIVYYVYKFGSYPDANAKEKYDTYRVRAVRSIN